MKPHIPLLCVALASLLLFSCNDDEVLPSNSRDDLVVMKSYYFGYNPSGGQVIVVTDPEGRILSSSKPAYTTDTPIKAPLSGYDGDLVNVYLIDQYGSNHRMAAFLNLKRGSEFTGPVYVHNTPSLQTARVKVDNIQPFESFTFSTDFSGSSISHLADTALLFQNGVAYHRKIYAQAVSGGTGRYGFFEMDGSGEKITIDWSALNRTSAKTSLHLGSEAAHINYRLVGATDPDSNGWGYELFNHWGLSTVDIYYPKESFAKYFSKLTYSTTKGYYTIHRASTFLNFDYQLVDYSATIERSSPLDFQLATSGSFDYYVATFTSQDCSDILTVFSPQNNVNFKMPDFPQVPGNVKFPLKNLKWVQVELRDYDNKEENEGAFKFFTSGNFPWPQNYTTVVVGAPVK